MGTTDRRSVGGLAVLRLLGLLTQLGESAPAWPRDQLVATGERRLHLGFERGDVGGGRIGERATSARAPGAGLVSRARSSSRSVVSSSDGCSACSRNSASSSCSREIRSSRPGERRLHFGFERRDLGGDVVLPPLALLQLGDLVLQLQHQFVAVGDRPASAPSTSTAAIWAAAGALADARDFSFVRSVVRPLLGLLAQLGELVLQPRNHLVAAGERRSHFGFERRDLGGYVALPLLLLLQLGDLVLQPRDQLVATRERRLRLGFDGLGDVGGCGVVDARDFSLVGLVVLPLLGLLRNPASSPCSCEIKSSRSASNSNCRLGFGRCVVLTPLGLLTQLCNLAA